MRVWPLNKALSGGGLAEFDPLFKRIGDARFVLLGEASHGTHEFYRLRADITRRLITEKHFTAVAVEADWPDAYRVNRYVRGESDDQDAAASLDGFKRFPNWMWRNQDALDFVRWLRGQNDQVSGTGAKVGFYGLDLYSLYTSIEAVLAYLDKIDPPAAKRARFRYLCLEHFGKDVQRYGYAAEFGLARSCEDEVVQQLEELRQKAADYAQRNGRVAADEFFYAEQNARLVQNAEEYYRLMFRGSVSSWNLRDQHLSETLDALFTHLNRGNDQAKIVLWAHNSHLGDARATEMGQAGELNLGQLTRTRYGSDAVLVGFTTYTGTVTAADEWNGAGKRKLVRPALKDSYEAMFHKIPQSAFMLVFGDGSSTAELAGPMLERAIGVIYLPQTERLSHYFRARLPNQFDAIIHIDTTTAVEPLEPTPEWHTEEWETYPSGV